MPKMDASFFKPFIDGTLNTLKVSCGTEGKPGKPFIKGSQQQPSFGIAAVIGLTSSAFIGTITICFTEALYLKLMSRMLGEEFTELTQELQDGAAELLNIIFGHAKVVLNQQGYTIQKAIPTVIRGEKLQTTHLGKVKLIVLPFTTDSGEFHVEIGAEETVSRDLG
jgi:chemotaxis protein CheX